jgi:hypothetical protein
MKTTLTAGIVCLAINSGAQAQQSVQWKASDGGNGHWYAYFSTPKQWTEAKPYAESLGGHLVTVQSAAEASFVRILGGDTCWIGLFQDRAAAGYSEPLGGWRWVTGEPLDFTFWRVNTNGQSNEPNNLGGNEDFVHLDANATTWNDLTDGPYPFAVEWDADCNQDGVVDYGQIRDGTFPDVNTNGVPDCCDQAESCTPCPGDVTNGGTVDAADLSILLAAWGTNGQGEFDTDLNGDGLVDGGDLALVLGGWGACP